MKKKKKIGISTSGRQQQRMKMRYIAATMILTGITAGITVYLNFQNPEKSVAGVTEHINTINYRSTTTDISTRYLLDAEQIKSAHQQCVREGKTEGRITRPSRSQDVVIKEVQTSVAN